MKKYFIFLLMFACCGTTKAQIGKVGINTSTPLAMLHVKDSSVLFTGAATLPATPGDPPVSGAGTRMMWYPAKAAFRAGTVTNLSWDKDSIGNYSFATGFNTIASALLSTAMGSKTTASGLYSTAMGNFAIASGPTSTATGYKTNASGPTSIAMGYLTTASGFASAAMGLNTTASGSESTATGQYTTASGLYSTAMGSYTTATGESATVMGGFTKASGESSTAMGSFTTAAGELSTAMGYGTYSKAYSSLSIGRHNDSIASSSNTSWVATDPVFIIGNGTANNARNNALVVLKNGNTNIAGNTNVAGEITRTATGTANIVAVAYGAVSEAGVVNSGTGNYTIVKTNTGIYDITITDQNYGTNEFTCSVTPIAFGVNVAVASSGSSAGKLRIRLYNIAGGGLIDYPFGFVVFKQ